jgi:radical SAM superfamily enzyme YgiQ (UPF0313 family)
MKITLINPEHHPHSMNFLHCMDIVGAKYSHMPLSLPTIAALTPEECAVEIIDENVEPVRPDIEADILAFTGTIPQRKRLFEMADDFRNRGKLVVIGGSITLDMLEECRAHADVVFIGEAEYTWPQFIDDYKKGRHKNTYHQKEWINMEDSPIPHYHLLKSSQYASGCIQVTRGCPYRCHFCDIPVKYGDSPRSKKIDQVLAEIRILADLGYDSAFIVDDNFVGNKSHAKALLKEIAKLLPSLPTKMYFYTQTTLDVANDDELLDLFQAAAFLRLFIGIETGDSDKLRQLNKRHHADIDVQRAVEKIKSYGITVWAGIMFGLEGDDLSSFDRQYEFIRDTSFIPVQVGLLQAVPDTPLYERALEENRLVKLPSILGLTALSEAEVDKTTNLVPQTMKEVELEKNFADVLRRMFSPEFFGSKLIQCLDSGSRKMMSSKLAVNRKNLMILMRMLSFYLFRADRETRRMFFRVIRFYMFRGMRNLDEIVFHLLAYKHMQKHYYKIAEICELPR